MWRDRAPDRARAARSRRARPRLKRFAEAMAARLGVGAEHVIPAYEDAGRFRDAGGRAAGRPRPDRSRRSTIPRSARASCALFERGLSQPTGFVLPLQRWNAQAQSVWRSESWHPAARQAVPGSRRFADRLASAAEVPAPCRARGLAAGLSSATRCEPRARPARRPRAAGSQSVRAAARDSGAGADATVRGRRRGAHGADLRAARRRLVRLRSAGRHARGLSRTARRSIEATAAERSAAGHDRGLPAAIRSARRTSSR